MEINVINKCVVSDVVTRETRIDSESEGGTGDLRVLGILCVMISESQES